MAQTRQEVRDALYGLIVPAWNTATGSAPLFTDNQNGQPPKSGGTWGRASVLFNTGRAADVGGNVFRDGGHLIINVFTELGTGMEAADAIAEALLSTLENALGVDNVWFRNPRSRDVGPDRVNHMTIVETEFVFDRIK